MEKQIQVKNTGKFKIIHNIPIMTDEEREEKKKVILLKMYNLLSSNKG